MVCRGVVHFKPGYSDTFLLPCAVKCTLGRSKEVGAEGTECGVHHIAYAAVVSHRRIRVVNFNREYGNGNRVFNHAHIADVEQLVGLECVGIGVIRIESRDFPVLLFLEIETVIFDRTLG